MSGHADAQPRWITQIQAKTGIDEAMIGRLVRSLCARVRGAAIPGPNA